MSISPAPESVPPEFECALCLRLLLDPVSVSCGHTFCRGCLETSFDFRASCPLCRNPIVAGRNVNVLIQSVIQERFPKALEERVKEQLDDLAEEEGAAVTTKKSLPDGEGPERQEEFAGGVRVDVEESSGGLRQRLQGSAGERTTASSRRTYPQNTLRDVPGFSDSSVSLGAGQVCFPGFALQLQLANPADVETLQFCLQGGRQFLVRFPAGDHEGENGEQEKMGMLFSIDRADRAGGDPAAATVWIIVATCEERVSILREQEGQGEQPLRLFDVVPLQDVAIDVAELLLPTSYQVPTHLKGPYNPAEEGAELRGMTSSGVTNSVPRSSEAPAEEEGRPQQTTSTAATSTDAPSERTLAALVLETAFLLEYHLSTLGNQGRYLFLAHHGDTVFFPNGTAVIRSQISTADCRRFVWYCCRVLCLSEADKLLLLRSQDLKFRLGTCHQKLSEGRKTWGGAGGGGSGGSVLLLPGGMAWLKMKVGMRTTARGRGWEWLVSVGGRGTTLIFWHQQENDFGPAMVLFSRRFVNVENRKSKV